MAIWQFSNSLLLVSISYVFKIQNVEHLHLNVYKAKYELELIFKLFFVWEKLENYV